MKFRNSFVDTKLTHHSGKESHRWLTSPGMNYWPQQLNFAVWCATTVCGISSKMLFDDGLPKQVKSFLWFHVYFTIRRILHELGEIQSSVAFPGDDAYDQKKNPYDVLSYNRLCNEFGISPSTDFRFHERMNEGLGNFYIYFSHKGYVKTEASYPGTFKFSDEGGKALDGNLIQYITNDPSENQYEHFFLPVSYGLSKAGQARLNQSIEAFVYCILGVQVNVRSSILGDIGSAQEVKREFLVLLEDAAKQPDISKSVQRFQLAVQEAKVKLDLAIFPGTWLV